MRLIDTKYLKKTQTPIIRAVNFYGFRWECIEHIKTTPMLGLPEGSHVYCLVVTKIGFKKKVLSYIGVTSRLQNRFGTHIFLQKLRINKGNYKVYILFRQFSNIHSENRKWESKLISLFNPPMNGRGFKNMSENEKEMWDYLGVKNPKTNAQLKDYSYKQTLINLQKNGVKLYFK